MMCRTALDLLDHMVQGEGQLPQPPGLASVPSWFVLLGLLSKCGCGGAPVLKSNLLSSKFINLILILSKNHFRPLGMESMGRLS